jgi:hypothetical protein
VEDRVGDKCSPYYDDGPEMYCDEHNDYDFISSEKCCKCGGGIKQGEIVFAGTHCNSDLTSFDTQGETCKFYDNRPDECNNFDDENFIAGNACCACGGGFN